MKNKPYNLLILLFTSLISYGQGITFQENSSAAARKLQFVQKLNKSGDSLILSTANNRIKQVDILNADYLETIEIDSSNARINLKHLVTGNYVVQAKINRHWIVMYLEKRDLTAEELKALDVEISSNLNKIVPNNSIDLEAISEKISHQLHLKDNEMYWVVYESNAHFSSYRSMSLKFPREIYNLINQIELEMNSKIGKNNILQVYEVFNKPKFMQNQLRNKNYYKRKNSKHFNVEPIYNSEDNKDVTKELKE